MQTLYEEKVNVDYVRHLYSPGKRHPPQSVFPDLIVLQLVTPDRSVL